MSIITHKFTNSFEKIINEQLIFIEKQSYKIVKKHYVDNSKSGESAKLEIENRSVELSNNVLDKLKKDDFKIIRNFNGKAKITTYLTTIISRQFVDIIRKKMGRSREKERSKEFGNLGLRVYKNVFIDKNSIEEFYNIMKFENEKSVTIEEIEKIVDKIKGTRKYDKRDIANFPESPVKQGIGGVEKGIIIPDKNKTPEYQMIEEEKKQIMDKNLEIVLSKLSAEEKFIIKLRFYNDKEEKKDVLDNIASLLNINKNAVYKRIDRILKKCKNILNNNGIKLNDIF